jgi:tryptophan halogenase
MELFREAGRLFRDSADLFTEAGWTQVLLGQGVLPERWHPLSGQLSADELAEFMAIEARLCRERATRLGSHDAFLAGLAGRGAMQQAEALA